MKFPLFFILLLFSVFSFSQDADSTLVSLHNDVKHAKTDSLKINALIELSAYQMEGTLSHAENSIQEALQLINEQDETSDKRQLGAVYVQVGVLNRRKGEHAEALAYYLKALRIFETHKDSLLISDVYHNMAMTYRHEKNHKKAITYYKKSIAIKEKIKDTHGLAASYNMMGVSYRYIKGIDSALVFYNKAKQLFTAINSADDVRRVNNNVAVVHSISKNYDKALELYRENIAYAKRYGKMYSLSRGYLNISGIHKNMRDYENSLKTADSALVIAEAEGFREMISQAYLRKSFVHSKISNYKEAYDNYRIFNRHSDSIYNIENVKKIQALELDFKFQQEKKEFELAAEVVASKKRLYGLLLIGTLLIGVLTVYFIRKDAKRKKHILSLQNQQLLKENKYLILEKEKVDNAFQKLQKTTTLSEKVQAKQELIQLKILTKEDWVYFKNKFEQNYPEFIESLKTSSFKFTMSEERFLILKKLNLDTNEISDILGISNDSVLKTQYRVRKKMDVSKESSVIQRIENN